MRDIDIRRVLLHEIGAQHHGDPDTLIVEELGLCQGFSRIDLAVINGSLHGYEIKSERDTLARLPSQIEIYNQVLDFVTIVAAPSHEHKFGSMVPSWWGVSIAVPRQDGLRVVCLREPCRNPNVDCYALVQLLWRDEALQILDELGISAGLKSKSREQMWRRLDTDVALDQLSDIVRERLRRRGPGWRSPSQPVLSGD